MSKINFRKSIKLGKSGVRLNLSRRGVGVSTGVKGLRVGVGPSGARARASLPGTGLYMEKRLGAKKKRTSSSKKLQTSNSNDQLSVQKTYHTYQELVNSLQNFHKISPNHQDWYKKIPPAPFENGEKGPNERKAEHILTTYQPNFFIKLFKLEYWRKQQLEKQLQLAQEQDRKNYKEWATLKELADGVVQGDFSSYMKALKKYSTILEDEELAKEVSLQQKNVDGTIKPVLSILALPEEEMPAFELSITKTGKLSEKSMTKTKFYALYQNYVCSATLHIIREVFAVLPLSEVTVHVYKNELNAATGHVEQIRILSTTVNRNELHGINFDFIQPAETIASFENHQMNFRKTKGFAPI